MSALGIGITEAEAIADAAVASSAELGKSISVAVVDAGGFLLVVKRTDGARPLTPNIAISKAYSAAVMQRPTTMLKKWQESNPVFFASLSEYAMQPIVATEGGVTIQRDGDIVGGLGIAGGTADEDQRVADAVLDGLGYELEFQAWGKPAGAS